MLPCGLPFARPPPLLLSGPSPPCIPSPPSRRLNLSKHRCGLTPLISHHAAAALCVAGRLIHVGQRLQMTFLGQIQSAKRRASHKQCLLLPPRWSRATDTIYIPRILQGMFGVGSQIERVIQSIKAFSLAEEKHFIWKIKATATR